MFSIVNVLGDNHNENNVNHMDFFMMRELKAAIGQIKLDAAQNRYFNSNVPKMIIRTNTGHILVTGTINKQSLHV